MEERLLDLLFEIGTSEYKPVEGSAGYIVLKDGRVFNKFTGRTVSGVSLKGKFVAAHRLVAMAFVPNPNPRKFTRVSRIKGDSTCNHYTNLKWVAPPERGAPKKRVPECKEGEKFVDIPDFPRYKVSTHGRIYSDRINSTLSGKYHALCHADGRTVRVSASKLTAQAFVPNPKGHTNVGYIDGDYLNTHYKNLKWVGVLAWKGMALPVETWLMDDDRRFSVRELCKLMGWDGRTLRRHIGDGHIPEPEVIKLRSLNKAPSVKHEFWTLRTLRAAEAGINTNPK